MEARLFRAKFVIPFLVTRKNYAAGFARVLQWTRDPRSKSVQPGGATEGEPALVADCTASSYPSIYRPGQKPGHPGTSCPIGKSYVVSSEDQMRIAGTAWVSCGTPGHLKVTTLEDQL